MAPKADWEKWQPKDGKKEKEDEIIPLDQGDLEMMMWFVKLHSHNRDVKNGSAKGAWMSSMTGEEIRRGRELEEDIVYDGEK